MKHFNLKMYRTDEKIIEIIYVICLQNNPFYAKDCTYNQIFIQMQYIIWYDYINERMYDCILLMFFYHLL